MNSKNYVIKEMTIEEFEPYYLKYRHIVFENDNTYDVKDVLSEEEKKCVKELDLLFKNKLKVFLGAFDKNNEFLGWSWGRQEDQATFYICNSGVLEGHRKKGVYTLLLKKMLTIIKDRGFQVAYSKHHVNNNAVIIPKLKEGFLISKMELNDSFGVMIHLNYYTSPIRKKMMLYRSGSLMEDKEIRELLSKKT